MIHFTDVTGLLGCALAVVVISCRVLSAVRVPRQYLGWTLVAIFLAVLVPVGGLPLAGYMRGATGDMSVTSLVLLSAALLHALRGWPPLPGRNQLLLLLVIAAAGFYPLALGWGDYDPYRLGFGSLWFLAYLLGVALLAAWKGLPVIACTIALSVLAWSAGWYESANLWDYLLDPMVSIYAVAAITMPGIRKLRAAREV
jgi:hypothetical protein